MGRVFIPFVVEKVVTSNLQPVVGASVTITSRPTGGAVNVFPTEVSNTPLGSITTDANGNVNGWIAEGSYNMAVSGGSPSISAFTEAFEAVYGAGVGNVAANAIGSAQIQAGAVGTNQLASGAVTAAQITAATITPTQLASSVTTQLVPKAFTHQAVASTGLTNISAGISNPPNACSVTITLAQAGPVMLTGRILIDKTVSQTAAVYAGIAANGALISPLNSPNSTGTVSATGLGGFVPTVNAVFVTYPNTTFPPSTFGQGIGYYSLSGSGDPSNIGGLAAQLMGWPIMVWINNAGAVTFTWQTWTDSGGTYQVVDQVLAAEAF